MASLKKLLKLWQKNDLITQVQADKILDFMKERQKIMFFSMLKWLMIVGTFGLSEELLVQLLMFLNLIYFIKFGKKYAVCLSI